MSLKIKNKIGKKHHGNFRENKRMYKNGPFFQKVKKAFTKNRNFPCGSRIENAEYQYFMDVLKFMDTKFASVEEKVNSYNTVFEQTKGREVFLASNQIVSKVLEDLIGFIDPENLERCFAAFSDSSLQMCCDRYASHVLQKMVEIAFLRAVDKKKIKKSSDGTEDTKPDDDCEPPQAKKTKTANNQLFNEISYNLDTEFNQEHKTNCGNFVLSVSKFMFNNLEDFVWDSYASHIMRTCITCLAGIHMPKVAFEKHTVFKTNSNVIYEVPSEWHDICKEFAERIQMWPEFNDLPYLECSSALLCILCMSLKSIDGKTMEAFGMKIFDSLLKSNGNEDEKLEKSEISDEKAEQLDKDVQEREKDTNKERNDPNVPEVFQHPSCRALLENLIATAGPMLCTQIYDTLFANKLLFLSKNELTDFAVQKLINSTRNKEEFEKMFDELQGNVEDLLKFGHSGVVVSMSSGCLRFQTKQAQLTNALQSALHLSGDKERIKSFFSCLIKLKPFEVAEQDKTIFVHVDGSLLTRDILRFNKPIFMVNCILETDSEKLAAVFNTSNGSRILDVFLQSKSISEKSRNKLLKHLEGFYMDLAITKFGSYAVESCFEFAQDAQKANIVKELSLKINALKSSPFGSIVNEKLRVETYRLSPNQWKLSMEEKED